MYTAYVCEIVSSHGLSSHAYADDQQLYLHCHPRESELAISKFTSCSNDVESWMASNRLKLNANKTEMIWLETSYKLKQVTWNSAR